MNTHDKIELPPNPITPLMAALIDKASGKGTSDTIWHLMQEFAHQATEPYAKRIVDLEADRQRRGEPDFFTYVINGHHRGISETAPPDDSYDEGTLQPLYTAPQPAEPVVVDHGETRMDADAPAKYWSVSDKVVDHGSEPVKEPSDAEDDIVDLLSEYADHNTEHGCMSFDKWTLREAVSALLARYGAQPGKTKLFAVNVLDRPMREHQPGKWETAVWPSECAQPAASAEQEGCPECEITHARLACVAPVAAQPQPSGNPGEFEAALKTAEAFNADIPVTEQEEEEWKRLEDRK